MKKLLSILLTAVMLLTAASAQVSAPSENLFARAKAALQLLSIGDYDQLVTSLPFSDISPSADEWQSFAQGSFTTLAGSIPQQQYAVAYWQGDCWKVAVPVSEPADDFVETLILISEDGRSFSGYGCAFWGQVRMEYQAAEYVRWNQEYFGGTSAIIEFDMN